MVILFSMRCLGFQGILFYISSFPPCSSGRSLATHKSCSVGTLRTLHRNGGREESVQNILSPMAWLAGLLSKCATVAWDPTCPVVMAFTN